ncbi:hypothetical protein A2V71_03525 [Candidatus Berkelbacteria bacterium RBG_13_40_8]|uniref:Pycsar effector protein domain-containing protein n=1 Tax=Candidatus Berkelbacteria bacterium RBG_13_40_8 TaxID=1797467 RepID=A0A1F5DNR8_9BACT|nr:MAG: hypothetical protein A2V71_03525 [Candidatus Berkelbacteria bacterium RBG_13_40_8]
MAEEKQQDIEKDVRVFDRENMLSRVTFMDSLLDKQNEIRNTVDVRTNIVIGFNAAVVAFLVVGLRDQLFTNIFLLMILSVFVISLLLAIIALKPPHLQTKKGQKESLFYHHYIESKDAEDYRKEIHQTLADENEIYDAYITEVYNLTKYSNIPRKLYLYLSIRTLIYGMAFVILIYGFWYLFSLWA